mgnify:FL=1
MIHISENETQKKYLFSKMCNNIISITEGKQTPLQLLKAKSKENALSTHRHRTLIQRPHQPCCASWRISDFSETWDPSANTEMGWG